MSFATTGFSALSDILGGVGEEAERTRPTDVLVGFDAAVQFSRALLQAQLGSSLARQRLSPLEAHLAWGAVPVPAAILARLTPRFRETLQVRESRLELRLVEPHIVAMNWPAEDTGPHGPPTSAVSHRAGRIRRGVVVAWRLELNALTVRLDQVVAGSPVASAVAGSGVAGINPSISASANLDASDDGKSWARSTLAVGQATLEAEAVLVSEPHMWRFGMNADFGTATPTVTADEPALVEFLAGPGSVLLSGAKSRLSAAEVRLTPQVAPAGPLSAESVQRFGLPGLQIKDRLLVGEAGQPILCLCVQKEGASGGVAKLIRPFLGVADFGYAASTSILKPALKARWKQSSAGVTLTGETPVEAPSADGGATETYRAQVMTRFADALIDVDIRASAGPHGDGLLLLGRQTIQLLNLWRENGDRMPDLGELGRPAEVPMALLLALFDRTAGAAAIHTDLRGVLARLLAVLSYPLLQQLAANPASISGFASAPLKTVLVKWRLKTVFDDVTADPNGPILGQF